MATKKMAIIATKGALDMAYPPLILASTAAMKAQATALAKDKQAFFEAGSEIYEACVACHNHYVQGDAPGVDAKLPELPNRTPPPQNQ